MANGRLDRHLFERLQLLLSGDQERLTVRATLKEKEGTMIATGSVQPESGVLKGTFC